MTKTPGTARHCLAQHLHRDGGDDAKHHAAQEKLQCEVGVSKKTIQRWMQGVLPTGETLVRVYFFLEREGYSVAELKTLNPHIYAVAKLVAEKRISLAEVAHRIGYPSGRVGIDSVLGVLRGTRGISAERLERFAEIAAEYANPKMKIPRAESGIIAPPSGCETHDDHALILEALARLVVTALPLARALESDQYSAEDRARLRELAGRNGVFTLANVLFRLCSEERRNHAKGVRQ